jgi:hypothetical protein
MDAARLIMAITAKTTQAVVWWLVTMSVRAMRLRHRHLAQRDTAQGAAVLAGRARGLLIAVSSTISTPSPSSEVTDHPRRRDVRHALVVPDRMRQEMLQPVRPAMPGRLGDRLAVVIFQLHQRPAHHLPQHCRVSHRGKHQATRPSRSPAARTGHQPLP